MNILYEEDDLIISDTGIVLPGRHIPSRQIESWSAEQRKSLFHTPDPKGNLVISVTLSSLDSSAFFLRQKTEILTKLRSGCFVKGNSLEEFSRLMRERIPEEDVVLSFEQAFIKERQRYIGITRALDIMLASKPA